MKRSLLVSAVVMGLIFTGCSSKDPQIDATEKEEKVESVAADEKVEQVKAKDEVVAGEGIDAGMEEAQTLAADELQALEDKLQNIYFDFDRYNIRADQVERMNSAANLLKSEEAAEFTVKVEGNTDEWGTDEYNYALGLKRGKTVKDALIDRGVDGNRVVIVSYGESNPVCTESNRECWQKNRRVEFTLLP